MSMFVYILEASERAIRKQNAWNRGAMVFGAAIAAYSVFQTKRIRALEKRVASLEKPTE